MIANKNRELIQAIKHHKCCNGSDGIDFDKPMKDLLTYIFTNGEYEKYEDVPVAHPDSREDIVEGYARADHYHELYSMTGGGPNGRYLVFYDDDDLTDANMNSHQLGYNTQWNSHS